MYNFKHDSYMCVGEKVIVIGLGGSIIYMYIVKYM